MVRKRWSAAGHDGEAKVRYLVRPRRSVVEELDIPARTLSRRGRARRLETLRIKRRHDRETTAIDAMVRDYRGRVVRGGTEAPLTGMHLVDITPADADRLGRDHPGLVVLRDRALDLIRPVRRPETVPTGRPATADLWHLERVGLGARGRRRLSATGSGVTVAVLDTGVDASHPELAGAVRGGVRFDVDRGAVIAEPTSFDTEGHGTHVAGLICGRRVGVAPGAKVFGAIMLPGGRGMLSDFVLALEWAGQEESVQIVNLSAGIPGWIDGMQETILDLRRVGVLPVVAVGNEGAGRTRSPGNYPHVVSVGAAARGGGVAGFSGGGRISAEGRSWTVPALVAPGEQVMSAVVGGGYEAWDGTSMAAPIVAGLAALLLEAHGTGDLAVADLEGMLLESCARLDAPGARQGHGLARVHPGLVSGDALRHPPAAKPPRRATRRKGASAGSARSPSARSGSARQDRPGGR